MKKTLRSLFEFQKYEKNPVLEEVIRDTETRYPMELTEEELAQVAAAGLRTGIQKKDGARLMLRKVPREGELTKVVVARRRDDDGTTEYGV